jgi:hypothetical protein
MDWPKHAIARNLTPRDNVCLAARDLDGDGLIELAIGADWNPGETTDASASGALFYLQRPTDPRQPWKPVTITPHEPTTHRMHWLSMAGGFRLAVLPLHGVGNQSGAGKNSYVSVYDSADGAPRFLGRVDTLMHMTHNFEVVTSPEVGEDEFVLVGGKEGAVVILPSGEQVEIVGNSISKGVGEIRRYPVQDQAFVAIEPMHGTDVALYEKDAAGQWQRTVIDTTLSQGHALAAGDICGDDRPEIVAGWRNRDARGKVGIKLYSQDDNGWQTYLIDDDQVACEDLKLVDLNGDKKLDIVAAGRATKNVVIYWNESE